MSRLPTFLPFRRLWWLLSIFIMDARLLPGYLLIDKRPKMEVDFLALLLINAWTRFKSLILVTTVVIPFNNEQKVKESLLIYPAFIMPVH